MPELEPWHANVSLLSADDQDSETQGHSYFKQNLKMLVAW
jgi:hypothetical protein